MKESSKATRRRMADTSFPWRDVFKGPTLDIGAGDDPLPTENVTAFDQAQGDANNILTHFRPQSFSLVHASNVLEHLFDPTKCVKDWLTLLRPGGHLLIMVPEAILYGDMLWLPTRFNLDHKSTWSMWLKGSPAPMHFLVPEFVKKIETITSAKTVLARLADNNYDYSVMFNRDQTYREIDAVEAFIEILFVLP